MFGEIIQQITNDQDLRKLVKKRLASTETYPPLKPGDVVRASSILKFCPRREALRVLYDIPLSREITATNYITFEFGKAFELMIRDKVLAPMKILIGKWRCKNCHHIPQEINGFVRYERPDECMECGETEFTYAEEKLFDPVSKVGGSPDGFIKYGSIYAILELKTISAYNAKNLGNQPLPEHVAQTQIYMHLSGYKKAYIWYFNKESSTDYGFWVDYDPEYAKLLLQKGHQLVEFFTAKVMPEKICSSQEVPRAKACQVCEQCFAYKDFDPFTGA